MTPPIQFRRVRWGMQREQVAALEHLPLVGQDQLALLYSDEIVGYPCYVFYWFGDRGLEAGGYTITDQTPVLHVCAFFELLSLVKSKYGEPWDKGSIWSDDALARRCATPEEMAAAIECGDLLMQARWESAGNEIHLTCSSEPGAGVATSLRYVSRALNQSAKRQRLDADKWKV